MSLRRSFVIGVLLYGLVLVGVATLSSALIAAALPLLLYIGAVLVYHPGALHLDVRRTLSHDYVAPDTLVTVTLRVTNNGARVDEAVIRDGVPRYLDIVGETSAIVTLEPEETFTLRYKLKGPRGTYRFHGPYITASDHFALFQRRRTHNVPGKLSILPRPPKLRSLLIRPLRTRGFAGPIPAREGGSGTDFYGVRGYEPGDPPRWINWRLSARHPRELFTNEFERERIADVGLILDARERTDVAVGRESVFEYSVEATAALAERFLKDGNHVGLLIYGRGLERTFPGYGKQQRQRILRSLAQARIGDSLIFDSLDYLPTRFFAAKSQLVLISPLCQDDPPVLTRLRARGYQILVVSPDAVAFEGGRIAPSLARDLAVRIAQAERHLWMQQLRRVGIQVVSWNVDQALDTALQAELKKTIRQTMRH